MINLNDISQDNNGEDRKAVFNNGQAGRATNVAVRVDKKKPDSKPNSPDYHVVYVDEAGGEVNDGIYYPDDSGRGNPKFALSRLVQLLHAVNPSLIGKELPEFETYPQAVDFLMKRIAEAGKQGGRVNVFVNYGTKGYPSQYLNVRKINFVEPAGASPDLTKLKPSVNSDESKMQYNDLMSRVEETSFDTPSTDSLPESDDLGWD